MPGRLGAILGVVLEVLMPEMRVHIWLGIFKNDYALGFKNLVRQRLRAFDEFLPVLRPPRLPGAPILFR